MKSLFYSFLTKNKIYPIERVQDNTPFIKDNRGIEYVAQDADNGDIWKYIPPSQMPKSINEVYAECGVDCRTDEQKAIDDIFDNVKKEYINSVTKHGNFNSTHEGWAVIKEELEELWEDVKKDDHIHAKLEATQVTAMGLKFLVMLKEKYNV